MPGPIVDIGRDLVVFASSQASFDSLSGAGEDYPVAADAIRVIGATVGGVSPTAMREDKYGSSTRVGGILQKRTADANISGYLMPEGNAGSVPNIDELLTSSGWTLKPPAGAGLAVTGSSSTTTVINTTGTASGWTVGGCAIIETGNGTGIYVVRRVTARSGNDFTIAPPLDSIPDAGALFKSGVLYFCKETRDTSEDCMTLFAFNNNSCDRAAGWAPSSLSFTLGSDDAAKWNASGTARRHDRLVQTNLAAEVTSTSSGTETWTVTNGDAAGELGVNTYWQIEDEIVKLTVISGTSWTVVRNQFTSGNPAHAQDVAIYPMQPAGTYAAAELPLPATSGSALVMKNGADEVGVLQVNSATLTANFGVTYREDTHGSTYKISGYVMNPREVEVSLSGWAISGTSSSGEQSMKMIDVLQDALDADTQHVHVQQGNSLGKIFAFECPTVRVQTPSMDRGAEEVTVELAGPAEGTLTGADEVFLMFG